MKALLAIAHIWGEVRAHAESQGQSLDLRADPTTIPPPQVIGMSTEQMEHFLMTGELPEETR